MALLAAAAAGGCGETAGPADKAHAAVATFLARCAVGDAVAAQYALNEPAKRVMLEARSPREGCVLILGIPLEEAVPARLKDTLELTEVGAVDADGGFATVQVESPSGASEVELEYVRGEWYIGSADAPPPPPPVDPPPPITVPEV